MKTFDLPSNSNYGDRPLPIAFPDHWDVHISKIHGYDTPALTDTYELEVEEELDERTPCYKVEFKAGGMEYEYKIDARTGGVLTYEMDRD